MKNLFYRKLNGMAGLKEKASFKLKAIAGIALMLIAFFTISAFTNDACTGAMIAPFFGLAAIKRDPNAGGSSLDEKKQLLNDIQEMIDKSSKEVATKIELEAIKAKLEGSVSKEELKAVSDEAIRLAGIVKAMGENGNQEKETYKTQIAKFINENKDKIKSMLKAGHGNIVIELKAVGTVTTGSATNIGTVPTQYGEFTDPQIVGNWIEGYTTTSSTNSPNYPYTEVLPKDGNYTFLSEAGTKQEIDFKLETRFAVPVKAAAYEKLTEEAMDDVPRMNDLANQILLKKHNIFKQRGIISGDGISPNPKGILKYGRAFVAGDMANQVVDPNFMDVVNACIADMRTTHNYQDETPFIANVVMVNDIDFFIQVQSAKDSTGRPLFDYNPITQVAKMGSVSIVPTPEIEAGNILVCDASKYNVVNYKPYTVRIGWVNDDFIKNQFVILGESRFYGFVKKLDEQAFIYDSIATIKDAIKLV